MNKLAVLISGSYRNFESTWKVNEAILNKLGVPYEVFFQTWSTNPKNTSSVLKVAYPNEFFFSWRKPVFSKYSELPSKEEICKQFDFHHVKVDEFYPEAVCREFNLDTSSSNFLLNSQINSCGMYLGIQELRKALERESGFTHFLRLRTDFILDSKNLNQIFNHDLIFFGQLLPTAEGLVGDQCYGGNLLSSKKVLATIEKLKEITSSRDWFSNRVQTLSENIIRQTLKPLRQELDIVFLNESGFIARPEIVFEAFLKNPIYFGVTLAHNTKVLLAKVSKKLIAKI
jgi:hypothetical protein